MMKYSLIGILCATVIIACSAGKSVQAQGAKKIDDATLARSIPIDYAVFQGADKDQIQLEVYFQVYNFFLTFEHDDSLYRAEYEFKVEIVGDDDSVFASQEIRRPIVVEQEERTTSLSDFRTNQFTFAIPPGKYEIRSTLSDKNGRKSFNRDIEFKHKGFDRQPVMFSGIEFVQSASDTSGGPTPFDKSNVTLIPSVTRRFGGGDSANKVLFYFEIYAYDRAPENLRLVTVLRNQRRGRMDYRDSLTVTFDQPVMRQIKDINIDDIPAGDYDLELTLENHRGKKIDEVKEPFVIQMSPAALLEHDFETVIKQMDYIAERGELDTLEEMTSLEDKLKAYDDFWERRDPTPGSKLNEYKQEFYRRVNYANAKFGYMGREGWKTDRGRIYITYGRPDQIDDVPYSLDSPPYQIWRYFRDGRYRRFVFVDANEDGEYRLSFPYDGLDQRPDF